MGNKRFKIAEYNILDDTLDFIDTIPERKYDHFNLPFFLQQFLSPRIAMNITAI